MDKNIVFGIRAIMEAVKAGKEVEKVMLKKDGKGPLFLELTQLLGQFGVPVQYVPMEKLNKYTRLNHQGAVALISPIKYQDIEMIVPQLLEADEKPIILILDHITDVRNFGAIARTAECVGAHAIVIPEKGGASVNSDAMKTSAGALNKIPVCRSKSLMKTVTFLKQYGIGIFAASEKSAEDYYAADYSEPMALIMGAEDKGVSADLLKWSDTHVRIPMVGSIDSLNVSVAAGVLLFEVLRQRKSK